MSDRRAGWKMAQRAALLAAGLGLVAGCQAREKIQESRLYSRIMQKNHVGAMAAKGRESITIECAHGPWENVSTGLIVAEPGTHEDVFSLRDRTTFKPDEYTLDEARRLVTLLRMQTRGSIRSADQGACIQQFAEHLGELTDRLTKVEGAQRDLDLSAVNEAQKQSDEQPGTELPASEPPGSH